MKGSPFFWRQKAEELKFAAEILWPTTQHRLQKINSDIKKGEVDFSSLAPDIFSIVMSLFGHSIEALFKGLIISKNSGFLSNGTLPRKLRTHDLILLANFAEIKLTENEIIFCNQALKAIAYEGRCPIAKNILEEKETSIEIGGNCRDVFMTLYNKIYPQLNSFYQSKE